MRCTIIRPAIAAGVMLSVFTIVPDAAAQHAGDVAMDVQDDAILTGLIENEIPSFPERVFASEFGESGFPGFTDEPGFEADEGTFDPSTRVGFNVLAGLSVWTGDGFDPTGGHGLSISFASASVEVFDDPISGFDIAVQPDGGWHRHLSFLLSGPGGTDPVPGVYLLMLEMYSTDPGVAASEPYWIVFNHETEESVHDEAIEWVEENLAGETHCPGDLDENGVVDAADLAVLLAEWGDCGRCPSDFNGDGAVNAADLAILLSAWGPC